LPSGELSVHREVHVFEFKYNGTNLPLYNVKRRKLEGKKSKSKIAE